MNRIYGIDAIAGGRTRHFLHRPVANDSRRGFAIRQAGAASCPFYQKAPPFCDPPRLCASALRFSASHTRELIEGKGLDTIRLCGLSPTKSNRRIADLSFRVRREGAWELVESAERSFCKAR